MRIEQFMEASNRAGSVGEIFELYKRAVAALGFDVLNFNPMTGHFLIDRRACLTTT